MALVVSILADSFDALAERALGAAPAADAIELRLDRISPVDERLLANLIARLGLPVIVAVHGPEAYGTFSGEPRERIALLSLGARAGAAFVDIDWRLAREAPVMPGAARRIVSRHEAAPTQKPAEALLELRAQSNAGDLLKLVFEARNSDDALALLSLLATSPGDVIAFASGAVGSFTRLVAPILGSPFTYAAPDPAPGQTLAPSAPGQPAASELRRAWPAQGPRTSTQIFAVVGRSIGGSISPRVHAAALRATGFDGVFIALEVEDIARTLALCCAPNWRGFAVTAPHKQAAFELADSHDAPSLRARASNTLLQMPAGWRACNTDVAGVRGALDDAAGASWLAGKRALVLGAGGAARAALVALEELGVQATLCARDGARAQALAAEFKASAAAWPPGANWVQAGFDVVVQCTSSAALDGEELLPAALLCKGAVVLDAVYRPLETPLLAAAARRGARIARGAEWFAHQAEQQFKLFTGREAPQGMMRAEVLDALAD